MSLAKEAQTGLQDYKTSLVQSFGGSQNTLQAEEIRQRLLVEGVNTKSAIIVVPYEIETLEEAHRVTLASEWHEPHTSNRFKDALEKRKRRANGESVYDVGFPTIFYSTLLDLAVVIDDSDINSMDYGTTYATGLMIAAVAHELAHSAFACLSTQLIKQETGSEDIFVTETYGIGQATDEITLRPGGGTESDYEPIWIDEAFAVYMSAEVRQSAHPESIPSSSRTMDHPGFGIEEDMEFPQRYLLFTEAYPDEPGDIGGSVAGMGMDILAAKRPWIIPNIKQLTTGPKDIDQLHSRLKNDVGNELYGMITERRPYETWGAILQQITEL